MTPGAKKNTTASILVALVVATVVELPHIFLFTLIQVLSFLALREFFKLSSSRFVDLCSLLGFLLSLSFLLPRPEIHQVLMCSIVIVYASYLVLSPSSEHQQPAAELGKAITGWVYVSWLFGYVTRIALLPDSANWILFLFLFTAGRNIWSGLVGRFLSGSPISWVNAKKTYSGAAIGLLGALCTCHALKVIGLFTVPTRDFLILGVLMGVLGQLGDLVESMIKRANGAVDSGSLFPGQGGVLDTIDSFLFTSPAMYYYQIFVLGFQSTLNWKVLG